MKRQSILVLFALFALNATANTALNEDPFSDFLNLEIEKLELEQELFGVSINDEEISIASLDIYELEEDIELCFNTTDYLPADFDARKGMNDIDWSSIELVELKEDFDIGIDTKAYLPKNFNPYEGMTCGDSIEVSFLIK